MADLSETEKLVELVKERRFLYDLRDINFKNRLMKMEGWLEIAIEMGAAGTGSVWSSKWKALKDNYSKYKKSHDPSNGEIYRKYKNWPWAEHMKFLDNCTYSSRKSYSCKTTNNTNEQTRTSQPIQETESNKQSINPDSNLTITDNLFDPMLDEENSSSEGKKRKIIAKIEMSEFLDYLKMKSNDNNPSLDEVDHFFLSYAQSFKKLPNRMQIMLKLEIATLFSRYELQAEEVNNGSQPKNPLIVSNSVKSEVDFTDTIVD